MLARLQSIMPYAFISANDPVFAYGICHVRWAKSARQFLGYSFIIFVIAQIVIFGWWLWSVVNAAIHFPGSWSSLGRASDSVIYSVLILSLFLANPILDFLWMSAGVHRLHDEFTSGRWDLLRLTPLEELHIFNANYYVVHARTWRFMVIGTCLRIWLVILMIVYYTLLQFDVLILVVALFFAGHLLLFVIEPWWRMRAVTAIGMAISARVHHAATALPVSVAVTFLFTVFVWLLFCFVLIVSSLAGFVYVCGPLISLISWIAVRAFYRRIEVRAIRYAMQHAFAPD